MPIGATARSARISAGSAVYAVSGWVDGYPNAVFRLLEGLDVPRKGLVGPWAHQYPDAGKPGPAIDFIRECVRWWDHWLKDRDTGIMDEPMLHAWVQDSAPPQGSYIERPGRWAAEPAFAQRIAAGIPFERRGCWATRARRKGRP